MNPDLQNWNDAAGEWDRTIAKDETYRTLLITNALEKILTDCPGRDALDAGCGNGYFSGWLAAKGTRVHGIDGSEEMVRLAKSKFPSIKFDVYDLQNELPLKEGYDIILANMLLMHMQDVSVFLKEANRLLKPGGSLVFSVLHPCFNQPTAKLYKSLWQKLVFAKPGALAYDYYSNSKGRFESHFKTQLSHYHRTLEEYSTELKNAGLAVTEMVEPHELPQDYLQANPKLEYATRLPRFLFFNCKPS
jgi:SAM-dependent methyltransferase